MIAATFGPAKAQTIIEMSALKCGDYLEAPAERQEQFAAWMSGYFNAERNMPMVDLKRFATNKKKVEKYCRSHKKDNHERHSQGSDLTAAQYSATPSFFASTT